MDERRLIDPALPVQIEKGEVRVTLQSADYQLLHVFDGKVYCKSAQGVTESRAEVLLVIPPGEGLRVRLAEQSGCYVIRLVPWLFAELRERHWEQGFLLFLKEAVTVFPLQADKPQVVKRIVEDLADEILRQKPGYRDIIRLKLSELFITLARIKTTTEPAVDISPAARGIPEIIRYLEEHYTEPITLQAVADYAGYSTAYLSRYFKKATGVCLFAYINKIRIRKGCKLLKHTDKTILEIALAIGYNNVSFFNRCFKRFMNMSPVEYRKGF